ncbi:MAG: immunoglobulin domain-containing protein [Phycisphaerales bacterium]
MSTRFLVVPVAAVIVGGAAVFGGGGGGGCVAPSVPVGERGFAVCPYGQAHLTVQATGTDVHYQWRRYPRFGPGVVAIPNSDSPTLTIDMAFPSDAGKYDCVVFNLCGVATTPIYRLAVLAADRGGPGGAQGADGTLGNDDFIVFISEFFAMDARADVGAAGGVSLPDGLYDNNDFISFINLFFAYPNCP